ncbi:TonB-dependent receptor [Caulobacter sp. 17J65-9]|uniref:TonB-dependent receptor domain-containing protein n=1 Tax=Caulobacter sp. 17J65-9 TaxID=2709382 RepID=UPI0013CA1610|nr:TonB-dependent receptor [Caulobacter sp. 17J65-9]NEX94715.1 TonB-dependent receptor [Caulobacter sp. 17J65-9]
MNKQTVRGRLLASTMICGAAFAAFAAAPAYAQDTEQSTVDEVVVTGSRIVRQDFTEISPVTTVGAEQLQMTATLSVESLLNELPQVIPGNTKTSNNAGGEDFATIDLRGLGTNRTLVLVNGERVPASSTTGTVDLNTIPASLIQRVEVVTGGASAVYGSDAISGVVNFILKDDYEGAEITATYGSAFDGNAPEVEINGLFGGNFADGRGNLTAYAAYYNREKVSQSEYDWSRTSAAVVSDASGNLHVVDTAAEAQNYLGSGGSMIFAGGSGTPAWGWIANRPDVDTDGDGIPEVGTGNAFGSPTGYACSGGAADMADGFCDDGASITGYGASLSTRPGLGATFGAGNTDTNCDGVAGGAVNGGNLSFDSQGRLSPRNTGGACGVPDRAAGSSRYSFAPDNYLIIPAERFNITTIGTYDITDDIRAKVQLSYVNSSSEVQLAPTPATGLTIKLTPAMQSLIQTNHADLWAALQSRPTPLADFTMDRRTNEVGTRNAFIENSALSLLTTVDGSFNDNWDWSVTASYGQNHGLSRGTNSVNRTALNQGLAGCQTAAGAPLGSAALPGCVPLDIFGQNTLTDEMVDFLRVSTFASTKVEEHRLAGYVRGDLMELPAGPIAAVFGFEYRGTDAEFRVDNEQRTGNIYGFNAIQDQAGSVDVRELYTELSVPLLKDLSFADYFGLELGLRYSDYSSIGEVWTYKIGGEYAPVDWLRFRAVYNEATRAPSVFELFQNGDQGFPSYTDPCNASSSPSAQLVAFCSSQAGGHSMAGFEQNNAQVEAFAFGNPGLKPETAETFTAGVVFQPDWFPLGDFRSTVDYYDIEIKDAIQSLGAQFWINQCYNSLDASNPACARVVRDTSTGDIDFVNTTRANASQFKTKGWDIQAEWSLDMEDVGMKGRLRLNELLSLIDSYTINGSEYVGYSFSGIGGALPEWKSAFSAYYTLGDWTLFGRWSYVPTMTSASFGNELPEASYVDMSARWDMTDNFQVTAFIGNVFDKEAPQTTEGTLGGQANTDPQVYRVLGRTFSISGKVRF